MAARVWAATSECLDQKRGKPEPSTLSARSQESLRKLVFYRCALDGVRHGIPNQPLPQPADFGLNLQPQSSADLLWRQR